jgi:hypothetical protein
MKTKKQTAHFFHNHAFIFEYDVRLLIPTNSVTVGFFIRFYGEITLYFICIVFIFCLQMRGVKESFVYQPWIVFH